MIRFAAILEGDKETAALFNEMAQRAPATARKDVATAAFDIQRLAKRNCPVLTGRLRASIAVDFYPGGLTADVGTSTFYGPYVEYGTSRQEAQPFLGPAVKEVMPKFRENIRTDFRLMVREVKP